MSSNYEYWRGRWQRRNAYQLDHLCIMQRSRKPILRKFCIQGTFWRNLGQGYSRLQAEQEALHAQLLCMGREPADVKVVRLAGGIFYQR